MSHLPGHPLCDHASLISPDPLEAGLLIPTTASRVQAKVVAFHIAGRRIIKKQYHYSQRWRNSTCKRRRLLTVKMAASELIEPIVLSIPPVFVIVSVITGTNVRMFSVAPLIFVQYCHPHLLPLYSRQRITTGR